MHDEKFVGEKSHLASNNKNVFNAGHVLTHYLRKLLGSFHFSTEKRKTQNFMKYCSKLRLSIIIN